MMETDPHIARVNISNESFGTLVAEGHLQVKRVLPASIELVWQYLTEKEKCAQWLATFESDLDIGSSVSLCFDHESLASDNVTPKKENCPNVVGKITECVPPKNFLILGLLVSKRHM